MSVLGKLRLKTNVKWVRLLIALPVSMVLVASMYLPPAYAADASNNTLKVTPVRTDIEVLPGATKTVSITATNVTQNTLNVTPVENDFVAGDESGTPALILDANQYAPSHSLKRFMSPLAPVTIAAGKSAVINVTVTVPKDAQAGGYFGAIRLAPTNPDGGGQVNLSASVASLILLTVPGDVVENLSLTNFDIEQNSRIDSFFNTPDNLQVTARFQNNGGLQLGPFGNVSVKNGNKVVYSTDFNNKTPRDVILPGSARRWDIPLKDIGTFGHYTVIGTFTYGKSNQTIEVTKSFWVIPVWMIIAAIAALIILIAAIVFTVILIRKRLKHRGAGGRQRRRR
ncbi:MAG TPA: hypothetical protein VN081_00650 [Dongiaceae bacterium]|nr:hypothetical protein [Dongiaceae bacterium]